MMEQDAATRAAMAGFDPKWHDPAGYILGITREIWEQRGIGSLHHYYAPNIPVRTPGSISIGNAAVIAATLSALAEFPDRTLLGEDVIWSACAEGGFLSSHRILSTATHRHDGAFGKATGRRLTYRVIADCAARNNQIYDEWLVRDQGSIVRQLGCDPKQFAADQIAREGGPGHCTQPFTPGADTDGGYRGRGNDHPVGARYADILTRVMGGELAQISRTYDRAAQLELPGGRTGHGHGDADEFWLGLRAAFPSARFSIEHQIGREDAHCPPRAALRWSLAGKHDGCGAFGAPSGAEAYVMGISHAEFGPWGLRREYVLLDEVAVCKQIILKTG